MSGEGPPLGTRVSTSLGELSSDTDLIVTDNFPPAGTGEYDLAGRRYLRLALPEGKRARRVAALVGFRRGESTTTGVGGRIVFTGRIVGPGPNPLMEQGVRFEVRDKLGSPQPSTVIRSRESEVGRITGLDWDYEFRIDLPDPFRMIRLASTYHSGESEVGRITGLDCGYELRIDLPNPCRMVRLALTHLKSAATIEAFNADGSVADTATIGAVGARRPEAFELTGGAIVRVVVRRHRPVERPRILLHEFRYESVIEPEAEVRVTAWADNVPVARAVARGKAGQVVPIGLEFDAFTAVEFGPGPAALVDLTVVPVAEDANEGWEPVPDLPAPLRLPVTHPQYPCTAGRGEDLAAARDLARRRILYGDPKRFAPYPEPVPAAGTVTVRSGSPILAGIGTSWTEGLVGHLLQVDGDATAYSITQVTAPDRLILSRGYGGASGAGRPYTIWRDPFGQLHDHLVHLVAGGAAGGAMADRSLPLAIAVTGTVAVVDGSSTVRGQGTGWGDELRGLAIRFGDEPATYVIAQVVSPQQLTLDRAYAGPTRSGAGYAVVPRTRSTGADGSAPALCRYSPLDLVLLAALHPAVAQAVGLYWVDRTAEPGVAYDYLLVADNEGRGGLDPAQVLALYRAGDGGLSATSVFNLSRGPAPSLPAPEGLRTYALPGAGPGADRVGLRWDLPLAPGGELLPMGAVMYHLWRHRPRYRRAAECPDGPSLQATDRRAARPGREAPTAGGQCTATSPGMAAVPPARDRPPAGRLEQLPRQRGGHLRPP